MASIGIWQIDVKCSEKEGSFRNALIWFMLAIGAQLVIGILTTFVRNDSTKKDLAIKVCMGIVCGVSIYLLGHFFVYSGCEELIRFWVLANLTISIAFTCLRMMYILAKEGKQGLKTALSKKKLNESKDKSLSVNLSLDKKSTFPLKEDFYSIAFYSYIIM
jgi:hypothetical protein